MGFLTLAQASLNNCESLQGNQPNYGMFHLLWEQYGCIWFLLVLKPISLYASF